MAFLWYRFEAEYERGEFCLELNSERVSLAMESLRPVISLGLLIKGEVGGVDLAAMEALISPWYRNMIRRHSVVWHQGEICHQVKLQGETWRVFFKCIGLLIHVFFFSCWYPHWQTLDGIGSQNKDVMCHCVFCRKP